MSETRARVLHWVVAGGMARTPDVTFPIDVDPIVVGRDPGSGIVVSDPEVSALHCELRAVSEGILVKDLGSTNGTFLGSVRVREATVAIATDLTVGATRIRLEPQAKRRVDVGFAEHFGPLVGTSPKMRRLFGVLERVATTPLSILIVGETGTGKELVAKAIHDARDAIASVRRPLVVVDCGSIPPTLAESILFGHERGAFTGATDRRKGALAEADGGTLFLDELGELPLELQPKLLRALSEKQVRRVGASTFEPIDVRVIAATRRDLGIEMNAGRFRSDLFFRIAQVRLELPPLRERLSDLPDLVQDACLRAGLPDRAPLVLSWIEDRMGSHDWPGNVRELVNVVNVAATLADDPSTIDDVLSLVRVGGATEVSGMTSATAFGEAKRAAVAAFERDYFTGLARRCKGNVSEMARQSGMERHHVRAYLRRCGIDKGAV
ncbi:MAG: sigma 54-interacting transcriptional regulator [Polyangiaceae bacterium]